jgi:UDP-glucose 4-epimerase
VIDEFFPLEPETLYGISKKMAEDLIGFYGFPSIIFRPSNIYGPKCRPYYNSVISTFCDLIVKGDTLTLNGTGEQKRDFLYVEDVVDVLLKAMEYEVKGVQAFNLCSGKLTTLNEVIETLKIISGKEIRIIRTPILEDNCCIKGNNEKAKRMLNWSPQVGLREGLEHTYMWFKRGNR